MPGKRTNGAEGEAARTQIAADVDALMEALAADASPRQSPVYKWLNSHHDTLVARLGSQRINWEAFAAHLGKIGLTDGKNGPPTASVARNTWHRVKAGHGVAVLTTANGASSAGTPARADTNQDDEKCAQQPGDTTFPVAEGPAQKVGADQEPPVSSGGGYPPGIRVLSAPDSSEGSMPASISLPAAPDDVEAPSPSAGEQHTCESISWNAKFTATPPAGTRELLRKHGGRWDAKSLCWSGTGIHDLNGLEAAVKVASGTFQLTPSAPSLL